jgi:regulatory protein
MMQVNDESENIRQRALSLLTRREHSRWELEQKLHQRGFTSQNILSVLQQLIEEGWQSDHRFAECYIRSRINAGFGPLRIRAELKHRRIQDFLIDKYLNPKDHTFWMNQIKLVCTIAFCNNAGSIMTTYFNF